MAKDFLQFNYANNFVIDKDKALNYYIKYMLNRTQSMFSYKGLPDTIPATNLELILQQKGYAFITEVEGKLYALYGGLGGELNVYEDATEITVANTALNLSRTFNLENDGVLMNNDSMRIGLLPILNKYGALLAENTITMRTVDIVLRMVMLISASDDRTYTGAEKFIRDIENGKISAVGESAFFEGIKTHNIANVQNYLSQFVEYEQYLRGSCFNEIGLNANYNMKHERIGSQESSLNDDLLLPLVDNMIKEREIAIAKINEKYGTDISIDFASAWKVTHEENEKQIAISENIIEQVETGNNLDVDIQQRTLQGNHDINQPHIEIKGGDTSDDKEDIQESGENTDSQSSRNDGKEDNTEQQSVQESEDTGNTETDTATGDRQGTEDTSGEVSGSGEREESTSDSIETLDDTESEDKEDDRNKS